MENKLPPVPVRIALAVIAFGVLAYLGYSTLNNSNVEVITASGSIEATIINVSPEIAAKISQVAVEESQPVKAGDALIHLDPSLLSAQRAVSAANLEAAMAGAQTAEEALSTAQSQYQITLESALAQDKKSRVKDWFSKDPNQFEQPDWYFTRAEQIQAAQEQVDLALKALNDTRAKLTDVNQSVEKSDFLKAEKRMLAARAAYLAAKDIDNLAQNSADANAPVGKYNRTHCGTNEGYKVTDRPSLTNRIYKCSGDDHLSAVSEDLLANAKEELDDSQKAYDELLDTEAADEILLTRAEISIAQERYYANLDRLRNLQTGENSSVVVSAQSALSQAKSAAGQAQKSVIQAQANLDLLDAQIEKLDIFAVTSGVILTRNVEPGEFVQPGAIALTMADLSKITITVYVPEDLYGQISLGREADVRVDSFPDSTFTASVIQIADQAEFTPRNVQTVEGRSATFYAIKLQVKDPGGKLKIGMPADVVFK